MSSLFQTRACIVGGGPAGMMAGMLLARAGVQVTVLEKHGDFLRDFRGDTVHPSTMQILADVGELERLLDRPHQELSEIVGEIGGVRVPVADFRHLPTAARFMALMPQWDFLDVLASIGQAFPTFDLQMEAEVTELIREGDRTVGVRATTPDGPLEVRADVVIGADGRRSTVREQAGLEVEDRGAPMDVLWMRLPREPADPEPTLGSFRAGHIFIMLPRGDYYQCGYVVPKGGFDAIRARGLEAFRTSVGHAAPLLAPRTDALQTWDDVKLLTVAVDRLRRWAQPGLLCIGDAAHAMSPIGGVGINVALQDAVAAANLLYGPLTAGTVTLDDLDRVQNRRQWPVDVIQRLQLVLQSRVIGPALTAARPLGLPWPARLLLAVPVLRRLPARLIGMGVRMERVRSPDVHV